MHCLAKRIVREGDLPNGIRIVAIHLQNISVFDNCFFILLLIEIAVSTFKMASLLRLL